MKGIWRTNPYGDAYWPPWKRMHDLGVTDFYVPALMYDPTIGKFVKNKNEITVAYKEGVRSQGFGYRIYRDPSWNSMIDAGSIIQAAANDIAAAGIGEYIPYMFDIEYHAPDLIADVLEGFRARFPKGPVSWTLEPFQGGWFTPRLVNVINKDPNLVVVPQNFYGNMTPADPTTGGQKVRQNLIDQGVASNRVKIFYDGSCYIPSDWDGCILGEETI